MQFCVGMSRSLLQADTLFSLYKGDIKSFYTKNTNRVRVIFREDITELSPYQMTRLLVGIDFVPVWKMHHL